LATHEFSSRFLNGELREFYIKPIKGLHNGVLSAPSGLGLFHSRMFKNGTLRSSLVETCRDLHDSQDPGMIRDHGFANMASMWQEGAG
jgi:hypothetical protein